MWLGSVSLFGWGFPPPSDQTSPRNLPLFWMEVTRCRDGAYQSTGPLLPTAVGSRGPMRSTDVVGDPTGENGPVRRDQCSRKEVPPVGFSTDPDSVTG